MSNVQTPDITNLNLVHHWIPIFQHPSTFFDQLDQRHLGLLGIHHALGAKSIVEAHGPGKLRTVQKPFAMEQPVTTERHVLFSGREKNKTTGRCQNKSWRKLHDKFWCVAQEKMKTNHLPCICRGTSHASYTWQVCNNWQVCDHFWHQKRSASTCFNHLQPKFWPYKLATHLAGEQFTNIKVLAEPPRESCENVATQRLRTRCFFFRVTGRKKKKKKKQGSKATFCGQIWLEQLQVLKIGAGLKFGAPITTLAIEIEVIDMRNHTSLLCTSVHQEFPRKNSLLHNHAAYSGDEKAFKNYIQ